MTDDLTDIQWCVLDLLHHVKETGSPELHRRELLYYNKIPQGVAVKLTLAALTMPKDLVEWTGKDTFKATEKGLAVYRFKFGKKSSPIADDVICLPDARAIQ